MVFSSILFLFRFLPAAMLLYYITPRRAKNLMLMLVSLFFYSWGEPKYFPIMIISVVLDYSMGRIIEAHRGNRTVCRLALLGSLVGNLGMLMFFKYTDFFIGNFNNWFGLSIPLLKLTLPLGISFYTFQTLSYTIGVYRGDFPAERNIIDFGAFVVLFPQLIAGPIVKYADISHELKHRTINLARITEGVKIFTFGLAKKVLIANNLGAFWQEVQQLGFSNLSTPLAWLGILAFAFQIYFDFSGYSQMAIGLGKMLGFEFPQNFNFPYISKSITEFWRRWHMTLGSWFREFLYIPLGGNRVGPVRLYFNLFVVWFVTGFWHGADWNFILWGLYFFVLLCLEKAFLKKWLDRHPVVATVYALFFILMGWVLFAITDLGQMGVFFSRLFVPSAGVGALYYLRNYALVFLIAGVCSTPLIEKLYRQIQRVKWLDIAVILLLFLLSVAYLVDGTYNPFLYFRF